MSEKSALKRKMIIDKARSVFAEKGFKAVTMKDIVDACEISRGGLYLYFSSTDELFMAVLSDDTDTDDSEAIEKALRNDASAGDMLALFLKEQKKEILRKKNNLTIATYEYFSLHRDITNENPIKHQFDTAVRIVETLVSSGMEAGEFYCQDPLGCARNLMYVIEGLKVSAKTCCITEETIDRELMYILGNIIPEE